MLHAENDRLEKEKQKLPKEVSTVSKITSLTSSLSSPSPTISSKQFYGNTETTNIDSLNNNNNNTKNTIIYSKLENKTSYKNKLLQNIRVTTKPYQNQKPCNTSNNPQKLNYVNNNLISKQITCSLSIETENKFIVIPSGFHGKLIDIFKTIPSRSYSKYIIMELSNLYNRRQPNQLSTIYLNRIFRKIITI